MFLRFQRLLWCSMCWRIRHIVGQRVGTKSTSSFRLQRLPRFECSCSLRLQKSQLHSTVANLNEHDIHSLAGSVVVAAEAPRPRSWFHQNADDHSGIVLISQSCSSESRSSYRIPGDGAQARWRSCARHMRLCVHGVAFALSPSCSHTALPS
jgi:hypothetical protein